jgi:hypothetical protein
VALYGSDPSYNGLVKKDGRLHGLEVMRRNDNICPEGAELGGDPALGVDLKVEQRRRNGSASAESKQYDEKSAAIGSQQAPDDAPEHCSISCARSRHHSPRRIDAGS